MEYAKDSKERMPYEYYTTLFQEADPVDISNRLQIPYEESQKSFKLRFMDCDYQIFWPDYQIKHLEEGKDYYPLEEIHSAKILVLRYLLEGSKVSSQGVFYTYRELPWGDVYLRQFHGRCIMRLAYGFGDKLDKFSDALEKLNAKKLTDGDCSYQLEFLDDLYVKYILWEGDDEFPPSAQILFSDNFTPSSFTAEDLAVVGDITIGTFKKLS